jgi:hypothetical protein
MPHVDDQLQMMQQLGMICICFGRKVMTFTPHLQDPNQHKCHVVPVDFVFLNSPLPASNSKGAAKCHPFQKL